MVDLRMYKSGIVLYIEKYEKLEDLLKEIDEKFKSVDHFFQSGDKIMLKVENYREKISDIPKIIEKLETFGLKVSNILTENYEENQTVLKIKEKDENVMETLVVMRNVRSGQKINHSGHLILIGNVHAGSEVIAGGTVVIFGECFGIVRAGMKDDNSYILSLSLNSSLVQIGETKQILNKNFDNPVVVYAKNGKIYIENFKDKED
ncbi:MAG: septum site-determining protein MinC [Thermosipho sp. (in: Bacteria)]|nr:septum site-determining protein MinC [Thermosipho sp. (in: thermotogales)]